MAVNSGPSEELFGRRIADPWLYVAGMCLVRPRDRLAGRVAGDRTPALDRS